MADNTQKHTQLCKAIEEYILWQGGYIVKNIGGLGCRRGRPDFDATLKGRSVYIEVKTGTGELSRDQKREKNRIDSAGAIYIEARSVEDVEDRLVKEKLVVPSLFR